MSATSAFSCPNSFAELFELMAESNTVVLGGGTALVGQTRRRQRHLLSLKKLGLDFFEFTEKSVEIGAMVTITSLMNNPTKDHCGLDLLQRACKRLASNFIRNGATLGGSTVACFRWSDLPSALLCCDAKMNLRFPDGKEQSIEATEFFEKHPARLFKERALLRSITLPRKKGECAFFKMSPLTYGYATWDVAVFLDSDGKYGRVAVSAGTSLPRRLGFVEEGLNNGIRNREELEELVARDLKELKVVGSRTVSRDYRLQVGPIVIVDTIERALETKGGANED